MALTSASSARSTGMSAAAENINKTQNEQTFRRTCKGISRFDELTHESFSALPEALEGLFSGSFFLLLQLVGFLRLLMLHLHLGKFLLQVLVGLPCFMCQLVGHS